MKLVNNFAGAVMNKDLEVRLMPKSIYLDAKNIRIISPDGQNSRSVLFPKGNEVVTSLSVGSNAVSTGHCIDELSNRIYWIVRSDSGSYICEYDVDTQTESILLSDTRGASTRVFNFPSTGNVEMRVLNDNDNGRNFLFIADGVGEPYYFEIEEARSLVNSAFTLQNVSLIKAAPFTAPTITLSATSSSKENNIEVKFLSFAYRYEYKYGEYSALSQFSEIAFYPSLFSYNYNTGTNKAMFNNYSQVDIDFNVGGEDVVGVDIVVKESGSNTAWVVESFDKENEGWADNTTQTIEFSNSKILTPLSESQLTRVFDNVPIKAKTIELIGNRVVFGNYTEGYNIVDEFGDTVYPSFILDYSSESGTSGTPHKQVKSNRDYELAISYTDGRGRMTTPLTSEKNTTFVLNEDADKKNTLNVTISSKAPSWATGYRFFIKQSKNSYDVIAPVTFYREGVMAWVRIEGGDKNKIAEGDFIYVKSDTSGLKNTTIRTKVLEIATKERNFLETDDDIINGDETLQQAGTYFRVEVTDFSLSETAVTSFVADTDYAFRSANTSNNFAERDTYIEPVIYKGIDLDDLSHNNTYTGTDDIRYEIVIDNVDGVNTFKWREYNVSTDTVSSYTEDVVITGGTQVLSNGLAITFGATTGHALNDEWVISCKAGARLDDWNQGGDVGGDGRSAIMLFQGKPTEDESIKTGATITLTYDDSSSGNNVYNRSGFVTEILTSSSDYPNLEEWFYGDNIISQLTYPSDVTDIIFRRGDLSSNGERITINPDGRMYLCMLSPATYQGSAGSEIRIDTSFTITEFDNNIIFETIPIDENSEIFYELPTSYSIVNGNHMGNGGDDIDQNYGFTDAVIQLDYFNSFGWYNGFESIKIGDTFNEKEMKLDAKPLAPIDNYKQITRIASLTYGGVYEGTTQFNSLNEFNLADVNYKDLDTKYGSIQKLHSMNTDLVVFQENKTHDVLYYKDVLYNEDGSSNITKSTNVLGGVVAKSGEYGIGTHPESFALFGNRIYHLDKSRGALMRLSLDGYTEVSKKGMSSFYRTLDEQSKFVGGYDPYNDEYLINISPDGSPLTLGFVDGEEGGFTAFYEYEPERLIGIKNRLYSIKNGQLYLHDENETRNMFYGEQRYPSITTVFNDSNSDIKHFKSINTESTSPWSITLKTPQHSGTISADEFSLEEGEYYAYIRQSESSGTASMSAVQGLGVVQSISSTTVNMGVELPRNLSEGDSVFMYNSGDDSLIEIGNVVSLGSSENSFTLSSVSGLSDGDFVMYGKDVRVEGEAIKGYYMEVTLTTDSNENEELFAISTEAVRSFD